MKRIRIFTATLLAAICAFYGVVAIAAPASAAGLFDGAKDQACNGANLADDTTATGCDASANNSEQVSTTLTSILNVLSFVVAVIAVIMLIIGGIRFITSQGDGSSTAQARNTIIYALVGIVVVAMAQFLVQFVIGRATKTGPAANTSVGGKLNQ